MKKVIIWISFALAVGICLKLTIWIFAPSNFSIHLIETSNPSKIMVDKLQHFEKQFVYPFSSSETFTIKHGLCGFYLAFFKSLGVPYYYVVKANNDKQIVKRIDHQNIAVDQKKDEIAAAVCCILRNMRTFDGKFKEAWYICDLKVSQKYKGEHLPLFIAKKIGLWHYLKCSRGFGICMNPAQGDPKAVSIFKKHGPWSVDTQVLNLYTLSANQVEQNRDNLKNILIKHGYMKEHHNLLFISTNGAKDYVITNSISQQKRPWRLFHIQAGEGIPVPLKDDATYMVCSVEGTHLDNSLKALVGEPSSTAQIISHGMKDIDFNFVTSNQI